VESVSIHIVKAAEIARKVNFKPLIITESTGDISSQHRKGFVYLLLGHREQFVEHP